MATVLPPSFTLRVRWFKTWLDPSRAGRPLRYCWQCCDQGYVRVHTTRFAYSGQMAQETVRDIHRLRPDIADKFSEYQSDRSKWSMHS